MLSMLAFILFGISMHAQEKGIVIRNDSGVENHIIFGSSFIDALHDFQQLWGPPESRDSVSVLYVNKTFQGIKFDKIELGFQRVDSLGLFNQARFYRTCPNKIQAIRQMKTLADRLGEIYPVSYDEEEDGTPFYKGGCAPTGMDDLFTIFVAPCKGKWTCQLRYGAFRYVHVPV
ncbi:hypothetical protein NG821_04800 [Prevotella cerevisiae]|jgi:hypothetical protein|uniref:Uncharacterized protein n=2 Tax=Segatella cerevisiae TaxID=2053716 RepID=A0ABT1BVP1_9BACT|nr:hypothetical protein [Segatella cerevisiae]